MNNLINVSQLKEVSETLLITLYARYLETKREIGIIKDEKAVEIVEKIDYDFSQVASWSMQAVIAIRTEIIDEVVREFLTQNPQGTIVNLGAGLCTRFFRLDNGFVNWYELDLPRVKTIWDKLIGESERHKYLSYSVMDFEWIERVKENKSEKILFIAEGLFQYGGNRRFVRRSAACR
jgi:O-methyltransferase involved in polyketide biosynthesis